MPIYEYECNSCHHQFECIQKMSDDPIMVCPHCSKQSAQRLISAAGFQLKGTGWYETDFKNKSTNTASSQTPTAEKPTATVATKSDKD